MKNPIPYLKHLVKDPINTLDEADARKKEIMPLLYGSLGVLALGLILQVVTGLAFIAFFSFLGLAATVVCLFLLSVISSVKKKFGCLTCDKCNTLAEIKTSEDFTKYISYTVEKDIATFKGYSGTKEPTNGVFSLVKFSGSSTAVISVELTCPHCGEVKHLQYNAEPFKCHAEAKGVGALQFAGVSASLENAVRTAINDYNTPDKKEAIPYTYQSSKNPNYEEEYRGRILNSSEVHIDYMGTKIDFHKDVDEMLKHYFVKNELNGSLFDPAKAKKSK